MLPRSGFRVQAQPALDIIAWDDLIRGRARGAENEESAVTIGVFDGVHRGHRALLDRITGGPYRSVVVTFSVSPRQFFHKDSYAGDVITLERKLALFAGAGLDVCVLIDFSNDFSKITGRAFIERLSRAVNMRRIVVGSDFHCGYRNDTDAAALERFAREAGIACEIVPPVMEGGLPVSSSRIRHAIASGDHALVEALLGRSLSAL